MLSKTGRYVKRFYQSDDINDIKSLYKATGITWSLEQNPRRSEPYYLVHGSRRPHDQSPSIGGGNVKRAHSGSTTAHEKHFSINVNKPEEKLDLITFCRTW